MSAESTAVLAVYWRAGGGDSTRLAHAAYVVATRGMNDRRGMPVNSMRDRIAAQQELLARIAPEIEAVRGEADEDFAAESRAEVRAHG